MKKVGILTINDYSNYGNRLQNYAVQEVLKKHDLDPITIVNLTKTTKNVGSEQVEKENRAITNGYEIFKRKLYNGFNKNKILASKKEKSSKFKQFTEKYISETDFSISVTNIPDNLNEKFDVFVTGSDQVWNPSFKHFSEIDFLTFASKNKRVAFSPSIGMSELPEEIEENFKKWIKEMNHLSIREDVGAELIEKLTGRKAEVLLDPTMLLEKSEWLDLAKEVGDIPEKGYVCTYFLGDTYLEKKKEIKKIAKDNNLNLINLGNQYDLKHFSADPFEFLTFVASSELFLTDSFHGTIFSILFNRPFIVYDRKGSLPSMNSRIDTLLSKFNLEERKWNTISNTEYFNIDYSHIDPILKNERDKAFNYLSNALKV